MVSERAPDPNYPSKLTVVTILPEIEGALSVEVVACTREAAITVDTVNPPDFTADRHRTVDTLFGVGPGMGTKPEPLLVALESVPRVVVAVDPPESLR